MITLDDRGIKEFEAELKAFGKKAYPIAVQRTLNETAKNAVKGAKRLVKRKMILKNTWTLRTIQMDRATGLRVHNMESVVGSTEKYMEDQEFGVTERKTGKHGLAIPTSASAGQGEQQPRTKLPRKVNKLQQIKIKKTKVKHKFKTKSQERFVKVIMAAKEGQKHIFMELRGKRKAILKLTGSKKNPKLRMVHDISRSIIVTPPNPWLNPAVKKASRLLPKEYKKALLFQIQRHRLFKNIHV